jgi:hypothetical protein
MFEEQTIRFSHPSQFNDTFDCGYSGNLGAREVMQHFHYRKALGILCLTETPDNHLMWVHYAAGHAGFVVGFRTTAAYAPKCLCFHIVPKLRCSLYTTP